MTPGGGRLPPRLYRLLLALYPRSFRDELGEAMAETFAEELAHARERGAGAVLWLWVGTLSRTPVLALEERVRRAGRGRSGGRGGGAAGLRRAAVPAALEVWTLDLRHAARGVVRSPGFALVTVLTVGLGVAATASLFSVVDALLLRPLPVSAPDRLVRVHEARTRHLSVGMEGPRMPFARYRELREATDRVFTGLAAHNFRSLSVRGDGPPFPVAGVMASGNYFQVLGLRPHVGRFFTDDEELAAVLGHRLWRRRFGGSADVVGRTIHVNGEPFTVVGVAPRDFGGTVGVLFADLWVPHQAHDEAGWPGARVNLFARLAPDVDVDGAAELAGVAAVRLPPEDDPTAEVQGVRLEPMSRLPASMAGPARGFLGMLLATAVLVLLIAAANVAGMLLARAMGRRRELAVRRALGVGRGRLVRQLTLEAVGLFVLGGGVGALGAAGAIRVVAGLRLPVSESARIDAVPDLRVVGVALATAALTGLVFGLLPALHAARTEVASTLRDGDRGASRGGSRLRDAFVGAQIALSVLLLVGATLFVRTVQRAMATDPGFDPEGVLVATVNLAPHDYDAERGRIFYDRLLERVRALPEVESAALAQVALLTGDSEVSSGWRTEPDGPGVQTGQNVVDGAWFRTMRVPLAVGRGISETDVEGAPDVVVVNETFARRVWPEENPVGRTLLRGDRAYQVVGVARDGVYQHFDEEPTPFVFLSAAQLYGPLRVLHVRTRPGAAAAGETVAALRAEVAALDPDVALQEAMSLSAAIGSLLFPQRFAALLVGVFGLLGLALACVGVYGVLAQHVARRTRELGIRVALGADARTVLGMVVRRGALLALGGVVVGLGAAVLLTRFLRSFLYEVSPTDAVAFLGAPLLLCAVAVLAGVVPARRALTVDPVEALRRE